VPQPVNPVYGFFQDENVREALAEALRALGFDAVTTTERGRKGSSDPRQLLFATATGPVFITPNNRDYRMLHEALALWAAAWDVLDRVRHPGILIIDQGTPRSGVPDVTVLAAVVQQLAIENHLVNRLFAWNLANGLREVV
jgi:hypothetical protein